MDNYKIVSRATRKALDVPNGSNLDGVQIQQWTYIPNNPNQKWTLVPLRNGYWKIVSQASGKVLNAPSPPGAPPPGDGVRIQQYTDRSDPGAYNQQWQVQRVGAI